MGTSRYRLTGVVPQAGTWHSWLPGGVRQRCAGRLMSRRRDAEQREPQPAPQPRQPSVAVPSRPPRVVVPAHVPLLQLVVASFNQLCDAFRMLNPACSCEGQTKAAASEVRVEEYVPVGTAPHLPHLWACSIVTVRAHAARIDSARRLGTLVRRVSYKSCTYFLPPNCGVGLRRWLYRCTRI